MRDTSIFSCVKIKRIFFNGGCIWGFIEYLGCLAYLQENKHDLQVMDKWHYFSFENLPKKTDLLEKNLVITPAWFSADPDWTILRQVKKAGGDPVYNVYDF